MADSEGRVGDRRHNVRIELYWQTFQRAYVKDKIEQFLRKCAPRLLSAFDVSLVLESQALVVRRPLSKRSLWGHSTCHACGI